jgi:hypothetical protein
MKLFSHAVALVIVLTGALCATSSVAAPVLQQHEIEIDGTSRRYFHLTDTAASHPGQREADTHACVSVSNVLLNFIST